MSSKIYKVLLTMFTMALFRRRKKEPINIKALNEAEQADYYNIRREQQRNEAKKRLAQLREYQRNKSNVSGTIGRGIRSLSNQRFALMNSNTNVNYNAPRASAVATATVVHTGRRGRPRGSYSQRYAAYGGVYEYRKRLNAQLRVEKAQMLRDAAVTPQQQAILRQIEARKQAEQMAPENRTIPDTRGKVSLRSIHQEIDDAAHLVD